jgi:thioredoxin 1
MLMTNLKHVENADVHKKILEENENVMICCGRMGPMCLPVYDIMEELQDKYKNVKFYDMEFDSPDAYVIKNAPECAGFMGLPFTMYYKNGKVVKATTSIQNMDQVTANLDECFEKSEYQHSKVAD